jgi:DNA-binding response OmpR family regulator
VRILLVEDEERLADALAMILEDNKYCVDVAYDGEKGHELAETGIHDIIVLDRMLPFKNGIQILKSLRNKKITTPILLLTAKDTLEDKVEGLDAGADDYLVKPFEVKELLARIRALSRRQSDKFQDNDIRVGNLSLDIMRCEANIGDEIIRLSLKEALLLELLIRRKGFVITKEQILDKVWGLDSDVEMNNIEIYIHYLRKKINFEKGITLETIRGVGYCLKEDTNV